MAVNSGDGTNQNQPASPPTNAPAPPAGWANEPAKAAAPEQAQQQTAEAAGVGAGYGRRSHNIDILLDRNILAPRPVSRAPAGEVASALKDALVELGETAVKGTFQDVIGISLLDANEAGLRLSCIVMTMSIDYKGQPNTAVYTLIVEGSGEGLGTKTMSFGNRTIEVPVVAGDMEDEQLWKTILEYLQTQSGNTVDYNEAQYHNAGAMVLPIELKPDNEKLLRNILFYSTTAMSQVLQTKVLMNEAPLSVVNLNPATQLQAIPLVAPTQKFDAVGMPVRTDFVIDLVASRKQNTATSMANERLQRLTQLGGFVDLVYHLPQQPQQYGPPLPQRYVPRIVITNMDTYVDQISLEDMLLALSTATVMDNVNVWGQTFNQSRVLGKKRDAVDLKDIGAVGYEVNFNVDQNAPVAKINTDPAVFGNSDLVRLIQMSFFNKIVYSLDVPITGPTSWILGSFIASLSSPAAYAAVLRAADNLTNGVFSQMWDGGPIGGDDKNQVLLGYYEDDASGQMRDLRDIDYLAMLNRFGERDIDTVKAFSATTDDLSVPMPIRLEQRWRLLREVVPSARLTGYARRFSFRAKFIETLAQALSKAGLRINPVINYQLFDNLGQRAMFNIADYAVDPNVGSGVFTYTTPNNYGGVYNQGYHGIYADYYQNSAARYPGH